MVFFSLPALLGFVLLSVGNPAYSETISSSSFSDCTNAVALDVGEKNMLVAPRGEELVGLINVATTLSSVPQKDKFCRIYATAQALAKRHHQLDTARKLGSINIIIAVIDNMDEYGRPNYAGMHRIGNITFSYRDNSLEAIGGELVLAP
tara:strand:+ start:178 stop:624 length:447 start_codon:yes stop_codon:yes gene_type:complete